MYEITAASLSDVLQRLKAMEPEYHRAPPMPSTNEVHSNGNLISSLGGHSGSQLVLSSPLMCTPQCLCRCHKIKRRNRLRIAPFQSALGSFVLVYSGWTMLSQHCDVVSCTHADVSVIEASYSLPRWSLDVTLLATFRISEGVPAAGLTVQRIIPHDTYSQFQSILGFSKMGNCSAIRSLLQKRPDAVLDVGEHTGATGLDSALRYHQIDACKLLLAAGADPFAEDKLGMPIIAYVPLYRHHREGRLQQQFEELLPLSRFYDEYELSHLHQVILRVRPLDLKTELDCGRYRSQLNKKDQLGYTPLHWAASQGDGAAVRLLLDAGANVGEVNSNGETPLHSACRAGSLTCAEALITAGEDIHSRQPNGYQPIHIAAMALSGFGLLTCLLSHGALINDNENYYQTTPLALTTLYDRVENCKIFLDQGAHIDQPDWEGDTPMFEGIKSVLGARCLALFLRRHCNYMHTNFQRQTLLHKIAFLGTAEQVCVLAKADLRGLDPGARDVHDMTAQQYLNARMGITEEHKELFQALLKNIHIQNEKEIEVDSNEDVFVDASEF
jgi:ankyrin repeat protein